MKRKTFTIIIGYLFLSVLLFNTVCSFISHSGFHSIEQVLLNTEAETNTKDKDQVKDTYLNEYYLDHSKLRFFDRMYFYFDKLQVKDANLNTQSFYPAIPTPPPNA